MLAVLMCLPSCGIWKKPPAPHSGRTLQVASHRDKAQPKQSQAPRKPSQETWIFHVDPKRSTATLDLGLDPRGGLLGTRPSRDTAPLRGKILVSVITAPNGTRSIRLQDIQLTNTAALAMPFHWARLVGSIAVDIPTGVLNISRHSFIKAARLQHDGSFSLPENYFTVSGNAKVAGSGMVLRKAVGRRDVDLTIRKTENVEVRGKLIVDKGIATLRIPAAVMKDRFDMEGSMLALVFSGDITATARLE